ncbi:MAG: 3-ketoacyl-ACP reductase [Clostridia bacterium]|nr:3-ketoacyl-ACP reductase [Clostridia bacterium]
MRRTAIVTGGSRGIGYAIARNLGMDDAQIVIFATGEQARVQEKLDSLKAAGIPVHYVQGNLSCAEDRRRLVEETVATFGRIDILVNNAGVAPLERRDLMEMTEESFDRVMGINLKGTLFLTQAVARQMLTQDIRFGCRGHIVNIGSCSAEVSSVSRGEYCISKAGISMVTTLFADRLATDDILVNEVRPGVISTDMTGAVKDKYDRLIREGFFPIPRWGQPEDVAEAVRFFCSPAMRYTTGSVLDVDGGFHIRRL